MQRLWLLDVASESEADRLSVWLWCKDENSSTWVVKQRYLPSFYLLGRIEAAVARLKSQGVRFERCSKKIRGEPVNALRVYVDADDLEKAASKLLRGLNGIEIYEEDLRSSTKYLLENRLKPCGWMVVQGEVVQRLDGIPFLKPESIEMVEHEPPPPLSAVAIDPVFFAEHGSPKPERDPIRLISLCFNDGSKLQLDGEEEEIIRGLVKILEEKDPDIIVGFGLNRVQWSYLSERAERLGLRLQVGRLRSEPRTSVYGHVSIRGRLNIDLEDMVRDIPELTVETLEEFINYLGIEREMDSIEEYELAERWKSDPESVRRYSMQRAEAIMDAYQAVKNFIFSLSELTGMPADYVLTASAGFRVENYLMYHAVEVGELIPKRVEMRHVTYPGGLVKSPEPGMHEGVAVVDFRSMYPSLMIKYNISFDTLSPDGENTAPNGYRFRARPEGFLPRVLKKLLEERGKIRERLKGLEQNSVEARVLDARQRAVKIITNAIYGYTGWIGARWYKREVAEATTAWGREVIVSSIKKAEELEMDVIYSDTDSLFLKGYERGLEKFMEWIERDLGLEAKIDKIFRRVIFTEAKKKYAGITDDGKIDIVGLEAVRGDWSWIAREAQREVIKVLLETGDPSKALDKAREYVRMLMRKQVDLRKLIIWRQITRPLNEYSATQPHIVVARMMVDNGWRIQPGDKVGYIITGGTGPLYRRVKPYFMVKEKEEVDWNYYIDRQVIPACGRILSAVGIKPSKLREVSGESTLMEFFD